MLKLKGLDAVLMQVMITSLGKAWVLLGYMVGSESEVSLPFFFFNLNFYRL